MSKNVFKILAHILFMISILGIILPLTYYCIRTEDINKLRSEHFNDEAFGYNYIFYLKEEAKDLIYNKDYYYVRNDGNTIIRYTIQDDSRYYGKLHFLIKYKNIAYTNVNNTDNTDTIEEIKDFIKTYSDNNVEIKNGNISTNKDNLKRAFSERYDTFNMTYYSKDEDISQSTENITIDNNNNNASEDSLIIEEVRDENGGILGVAEITNEGVREINEYDEKNLSEYNVHQVVINDFEIYSNFKEELYEDYYSQNNIVLSNYLGKYENAYNYILPISVILFLIITIYFLYVTGKTKDGERLELNDVDKIYIEIIMLIVFIVTCIIFGLVYKLYYENIYLKLEGILLLLFIYIATYIMYAIIGCTIIRRLKAKRMIDTSITLKICRWCVNKCKDILNYCFRFLRYIRNQLIEVLGNRRLFVRLCIYLGLLLIVMIYMVGLFEIIGVIIDGWILVFILFRVYKYLNSVEKIEKHLKDMYEGNNVDDLDLLEVDKELKNMSKYINNISDGLDSLVEEQMKSERLKTELITNVSHDIKTPLTSIINYVDLLKKEKLDNKKAEEYLEVLDNKSQRLKKLIEDLVDASKASSGNVKLNLEKVNLIELVKQSIGEFEDKFKSKGLKVELKKNKDNIYLMGDSKQLYRVIENTFTNIEKYALENTRVYININEEDGFIKFDIKNISKEELNISSEELMQRFVRGDKSRTTEGSGLGISISKSLVELQRGKFDIVIDGDLFKVSMVFEAIN